MSHLENLIFEYMDWQNYLVKRNRKVGKLSHGGWETELDIIGFHPETKDLVHYEPSVDAHSWETRDRRFQKKFNAGQKHVSSIFTHLPEGLKLRQIAIFPAHPVGRDEIAGGKIQSIDELVREIRHKILDEGPAYKKAIPEIYPMLRTIQLSHCGYVKAIK